MQNENENRADRRELGFRGADLWFPWFRIVTSAIAGVLMASGLHFIHLNELFRGWLDSWCVAAIFTFAFLPRIAPRAETPVRHETENAAQKVGM